MGGIYFNRKTVSSQDHKKCLIFQVPASFLVCENVMPEE